jgi:hypothetical protein
MTALEELKESAKESLSSKQRSLSELSPEKESDETLRDTLLDLLSETVTMYKLTIAQVRKSKDVDEIAGLWKETHEFYAGMQKLWSGMSALYGPKDELFLHWGRTIDKLERTTAEHYAFHAE